MVKYPIIDLLQVYILYAYQGSSPSFVYKLDKSQSSVFLQRVLPFLRAEKHNKLNNRLAVLERGQSFALHQEFLAVGSDQRLGQEGREVHHDLSQKGANGPQGGLQLLGEGRLPRGRRHWQRKRLP